MKKLDSMLRNIEHLKMILKDCKHEIDFFATKEEIEILKQAYQALQKMIKRSQVG